MKINVKGAEFSARALAETLVFGDVGFGDAFMRGEIKVRGVLSKFIKQHGGRKGLELFRGRARGVSEHYDIPAEFYEILLGKSMAYTCGLFKWFNSQNDLYGAQQQKYGWHAERLKLGEKGEGLRLLDCGFGWGGFARYVCKHWPELDYTGIGNSREQLRYASAIGQSGVLLQRDWRDHSGLYDRFTAIGMLEHVGRDGLSDYFRWIRSRLTRDGIGTLQFISRTESMSRWFDKHIFPGAYPPSRYDVLDLMRGSGLGITEVHNASDDYAKTCQCWLNNLLNNLDAVREMGFDERFIRMFKLYLSGGIASFESGKSQLFLFQFKVIR